MSDYSPTSSSYETVPTSPSVATHNSRNPIPFGPRSTRSAITDEIVILGQRNIQQLQLDIARAERVTNRLEASLSTTIRDLDRELIELHRDMKAILQMRKEDLKRAQRRRNQNLLFCVLGVLNGFLLFWVLKHRG
ncbi:hypothetical protein FCOIX_2711 [Fusarium coicis]|nr:hypothetical protein FCOIX_2711 [Fusarium coicis]